MAHQAAKIPPSKPGPQFHMQSGFKHYLAAFEALLTSSKEPPAFIATQEELLPSLFCLKHFIDTTHPSSTLEDGINEIIEEVKNGVFEGAEQDLARLCKQVERDTKCQKGATAPFLHFTNKELHKLYEELKNHPHHEKTVLYALQLLTALLTGFLHPKISDANKVLQKLVVRPLESNRQEVIHAATLLHRAIEESLTHE